MGPIPMPDVLDDHAQLITTGSDPDLLREAFQRACAYAQQLWRDLYAVRDYLLDSTADGSSRPRGRDDDAGWEQWVSLYRTLVTTLAGPRGDSGHALYEARSMAAIRRDPDVPGPDAIRGGVQEIANP